MKVTIKDIAQRAGVSVTTVSNAINGRGGVSADVRDRIMRLVSEMEYRLDKPVGEQSANAYIRLVMCRRHGMIAQNTQFFAEVLGGVEQCCHTYGMELMVTNINDVSHQSADVMSRIMTIRQERCAGIVLFGTEMEEEDLSMFLPCASPLVVLDNLFRHQRVHTVVMNNYNAGYDAVMYLNRMGHRDIGLITSNLEFNNIRYRRKGYEAAMTLCGLTCGAETIWPVTPTVEGAYQDMKALLQSGRSLPTAFFAGNDIMAFGCMRAMQEQGLRIPEDVSIVGMDDMDICLLPSPKLTTMRVYRAEIGQMAVDLLRCQIPKLKNSIVKAEMDVELIERGSVMKRS